MTRMKYVFAVLAVVAAVVLVAPAAHAVTNPCTASPSISCHYVGAGSSAQFLSAALGADQFAVNIAAGSGGTLCPYHWTAKNSANVIDNRDSRIQPELGSVFIVWDAACSDSTGNTGVTDLWVDVQVDSTVGCRTFLAVNADGSDGAQLQIIPAASGGLVSPQTLWPDGNADVSLLTAPNVSAAIGTSSSGGQHMNVGLTDIRPEDALYATTRAMGTLNTTTWSGLGYKGPTAEIGAPIYTNQGTGTKAVPVKFALSGTDPITGKPARSFTTVPVGASPIIFGYNNAGSFDSNVENLEAGIGITGTASKKAAHLWDGTTSCNAANPAFGGTGSASNTITVVLREPLSGTMNTTEFTTFRTTGNTHDSQEVGVINPFNTPYNPLDLACTGSSNTGHRVRAIGTGEVVNAILQKVAQPDARVIGYFFWGFANASKLTGASFNYLTVDGVNPLFGPLDTPPANQEFPNCAGPCPSSGAGSIWTGPSFPHVRDGTYKQWSLLRWLVPTGDSDPYGPTQLASQAQVFADEKYADYVPFSTSTDGLDVYRSHFKQSLISGNNGAVNGTCNGVTACTLGGTAEAGGDEGGEIVGPFPVCDTVDVTNGSPTVTKDTGTDFSTGLGLVSGNTVSINSVNYTITGTPTPTSLTLSTNYTGTTGDATACFNAQTPGLLNKKQ